MGTTVLVSGGQYYEDAQHVYTILDNVHQAHQISKLVHTGRREYLIMNLGARKLVGVDGLAEEWARSHCVPYAGYPPDHARHGDQALDVAYASLLDLERPKMVLLFPGGAEVAVARRFAIQDELEVRECP